MKRILTIGLLAMLAGCAPEPKPTDPIKLCNYWGAGDKSPVTSEFLGMWQYTDPTNGCRYISGEVHGTYTHDGAACKGPQKCSTVTRAEWEAMGKP